MATGALLRLLRPRQWYKNLIVFVPLVFSDNAFTWALWPKALLAFVAFCLLSGGAYAWNDVLDVDRDRTHPKKRLRPIASGAVSVPVALFLGLAAACTGLLLLGSLNGATLLLGVFYLMFQLAYNLFLKNQVIWDVLTIGIGFVLRAAAGTLAIGLSGPTVWLILCTFLFAIFLGFAKRRHELVTHGRTGDAGAKTYRETMKEYTVELVEEMTLIVAGLLLTAYSLYTFFGSAGPWMMITIPFVLYGVFRYLYLVHRRDLGDEPELIFRDRPTLANAFVWLIVVVLVLRGWPQALFTWLQGV
jgi:4-hydroxybenzoate polyprenyltransferase